MSARLMKLGTLASLALTIGGCTTLGGNVKGDFACRAPTSSCAPTSAIDEQATNAMQPQGANAPSLSPRNDAIRAKNEFIEMPHASTNYFRSLYRTGTAQP